MNNKTGLESTYPMVPRPGMTKVGCQQAWIPDAPHLMGRTDLAPDHQLEASIREHCWFGLPVVTSVTSLSSPPCLTSLIQCTRAFLSISTSAPPDLPTYGTLSLSDCVSLLWPGCRPFMAYRRGLFKRSCAYKSPGDRVKTQILTWQVWMEPESLHF